MHPLVQPWPAHTKGREVYKSALRPSIDNGRTAAEWLPAPLQLLAASVHRLLWTLCTTAAAPGIRAATWRDGLGPASAPRRGRAQLDAPSYCGSGHGPDRSQRTENARGRAGALSSVVVTNALPALSALVESFGPPPRTLEEDGLAHGGRSYTRVKAVAPVETASTL